MKKKSLKYILFMLSALIAPALLSVGVALADVNFNYFVMSNAAKYIKEGEEKMLVRLDNKDEINEDWRSFATTYNRRHQTYSSIFRHYSDVVVSTAGSERRVHLADINLRSSNVVDTIEGIKIIDMGHSFQDLLTADHSLVISTLYATTLMNEKGVSEMKDLLNVEVNVTRDNLTIVHKVRAIYDVNVKDEYANNKYYETFGDLFFVIRENTPLFDNPEYYLTLGRDQDHNITIYDDLQYLKTKWAANVAKTSIDSEAQTLINKYDDLIKDASFNLLRASFIIVGSLVTIFNIVVITLKVRQGKKDWEFKKFDGWTIALLIAMGAPLLLMLVTSNMPLFGLILNRLTPLGIALYALSALSVYLAYKAQCTKQEAEVSKEEEN